MVFIIYSGVSRPLSRVGLISEYVLILSNFRERFVELFAVSVQIFFSEFLVALFGQRVFTEGSIGVYP